MPKLTTTQRAIIEKASADLCRYNKAGEEHAAMLRRDWEGYAKVYEEYSARSKHPMGFMPAPDDINYYIEESEKVLKKECTTLLE
jgi:hypothetical protein